MPSNIKEGLGINRFRLTGKLNIGSITPDIVRKIARAQELTRTIEEIKHSRGGVVSADPIQAAEKSGIYKRLGVTKEEVLEKRDSSSEVVESQQSDNTSS